MKLSRILLLSLLLLFVFPIQTEVEREDLKQEMQSKKNFIKDTDHVFSNYIHNYNSSRSNK